jgi:hypothetical protein
VHEYDVNEYLRKKRKKQQLKDKVLIALFFINVFLFCVSVLTVDSDTLIPSIVGLCSVTYLLAFTYANVPRGDE